MSNNKLIIIISSRINNNNRISNFLLSFNRVTWVKMIYRMIRVVRKVYSVVPHLIKTSDYIIFECLNSIDMIRLS